MCPQNLRPFTHLHRTRCAEAVDTSGVNETSKMQRFDVLDYGFIWDSSEHKRKGSKPYRVGTGSTPDCSLMLSLSRKPSLFIYLRIAAGRLSELRFARQGPRPWIVGFWVIHFCDARNRNFEACPAVS